MRTILIRDYTFAALKFYDKNSIVHVNNSSYIQKQFLTTSKSIIDVSTVTLIIQLPQLLNNTLTQLAIFVYDLYNYFAWHSHMSHSRFNSVHFVTQHSGTKDLISRNIIKVHRSPQQSTHPHRR